MKQIEIVQTIVLSTQIVKQVAVLHLELTKNLIVDTLLS